MWHQHSCSLASIAAIGRCYAARRSGALAVGAFAHEAARGLLTAGGSRVVCRRLS